MSTNVEKGIFKAKIDGELKEVYFKTDTENVMVSEGEEEITLAEKLKGIETNIEDLETGEGTTNIIESIVVNGEEVEVGENKSVDIKIPQITVGVEVPEDIADGELFIQIGVASE